MCGLGCTHEHAQPHAAHVIERGKVEEQAAAAGCHQREEFLACGFSGGGVQTPAKFADEDAGFASVEVVPTRNPVVTGMLRMRMP